MEYLSNGDLFTFMHPEISPGEFENIESEKFPWKNRLKIALCIAKGMHYLHSITPPIAHLDLRSPNIFVTFLCHYSFYLFLLCD